MNSQRCSCRRVSIPNWDKRDRPFAEGDAATTRPDDRAQHAACLGTADQSRPAIIERRQVFGKVSRCDLRVLRHAQEPGRPAAGIDHRRNRSGEIRVEHPAIAVRDRDRHVTAFLRQPCDNCGQMEKTTRISKNILGLRSNQYRICNRSDQTNPATRRNSILSQLPKVRKHSPIDTSAPRQTSGRPCG